MSDRSVAASRCAGDVFIAAHITTVPPCQNRAIGRREAKCVTMSTSTIPKNNHTASSE